MKRLRNQNARLTYEFIKDFVRRENMPPTRREIAVGRGISVSSADYHITVLAKHGYISVKPLISRGIILNKGDK